MIVRAMCQYLIKYQPNYLRWLFKVNKVLLLQLQVKTEFNIVLEIF